MDDKYDKILGQVRALLAKADSTTFEHEADALRGKAEALMLKYRIEEAIVFEKKIGQAEPLEPVWSTITLYSYGSDFGTRYSRIAGTVMRHVGAKGVVTGGEHGVMLKMVGFPSDLRYAEVLLTSSLLEFSKRLEPKVDVNATPEENAWNLRSAGWTRKRIARELFGDWSTENEMKAKNRKVTALIKKHGAAIGEDADAMLGRGNNMDTYKESYADGFVETLARRLLDMRTTAQEMNAGALVPQSRMEAVLEAYYTAYPQHRPTESKGPVSTFSCEKCKKAKSGYCRDHQWMKPSTRTVYRSHNGRAYDRGRTAAYGVNLGPDGAGRKIGS